MRYIFHSRNSVLINFVIFNFDDIRSVYKGGTLSFHAIYTLITCNVHIMNAHCKRHVIASFLHFQGNTDKLLPFDIADITAIIFV